ncbi:PAS domain S-box protein [Romeria aff. gracilis LEGE 07310]|uniref:PAS domain S-box protein n=1 Tax=Vasconcelosia minhoensis LEGE 07310 TaxID=915328 RepID=A0A8J7DQX2_9CYAN|nr:PAS domain S-box protein [Romeria gracilis]MBE9077299.1 PAS domain S-box protein [Romeria aff. gracilis LEGE 07310]
MHESEAQFRSAFDYAAIGMALVGLDGRWLQVNRSLCEIVGYSESELLALTFQDITHPADLAADLDYVQQLLAGEIRSYQMEKRYFHQQGHEVWVLLSVSLVSDQDQRPLYFIAQIQDISQSKKISLDLQAYQAESQALFEAMTDVVLIRDVQGRCLKVLSTRATSLFLPAAEMLGKTLHESLPQAQADTILGYLQEALTARQPIQGEYSLTVRGRTVHFLGTFSPLAADQVLIVAQDITARKQALSDLRLQGLIAKNMGEGVCLVSTKTGEIVYTNPKFEQLFGYDPGELVGKHVSLLNYGDEEASGAEVADRLMAEIRRQGVSTYEVKNVKKDGTPFWCRATTSVILEHPEHGTVLAAVQADITAEKQAQADIRLLQDLALAISQAADFEAAISLILRQVSETYGWAYAEAWIPDSEEGLLKCSPVFYSCSRAQAGLCDCSPWDCFRRLSETLTLRPGVELAGRVWASRQPEWQVDVTQDPEAAFLYRSVSEDCGLKTRLGIPITADDQVLAVLIFCKLEVAQVDQTLMANLSAAAAQLNLVMQRKRAEDDLFKEKELAQVTLNSIGDGVIATDARGRIQYLNPIAQSLTGWSQAEAQGQPLTEVFRIVNGTTREPVPNPAQQVLAEECITVLAANTVLIHRDGREIPIDDSTAPIRSRNNQVIGTVIVFQDISSRALSQQLTWQATHDSLTQTINRPEFERRLELAIEMAKTHHQSHVLCYLDLDQFKIVNDTCGHTAGDELLRQIVTLFQANIRKADTLGRLGGDEFGLLLYQCSLEQACRVIRSLQGQVQDFRFRWEDKSFSIGVSVGAVVIDADCQSGDCAMIQADGACYAAKRRGRNRIHIYQSSDDELVQQQGQLQWVNRLTQALEADRFCLYCQSIISIANPEMEGEHYEVLLRLRDESEGLISPDAFIQAAERYSLMHLIDRWVIRTLFSEQGAYYRTVWEHLQDGTECSYLYTVNLSGASINDDQFIDFLREQLALHQIPPQLICFEITETVAIANLNKAAQFMQELQVLGCRFALDDFGSGMSSFGYLRSLPVDYIKIDGGFVKEIVDNPVDAAMVEAINRVGQVMGIQTIAEFVENEDILEKLKTLGVDYAQGYGIAKPRQL